MKNEKWTEDKIAKIASVCKTKQEMKNRFPKEYAAAKRMGILKAPMFSHMLNRLNSSPSSKWSKKEDVLAEAAKYSDRKSFFNGSRSCYNAAKARGWFEEACNHMPKNKCIGNKPPTFKWSKEAVAKEALKYDNKTDFGNKSAGACDAARKNGWIKEICAHMKVFIKHYELKELIEIFKDCKNKKEAREKDPNAYNATKRKRVQHIVFAHMPKRIDLSGKNSPFYKKDNEEIRQEALKYDNKITFLMKNPAMYQLAYKRGVLEDFCSHMKGTKGGSSLPERELLSIVKSIHPSAKKIRDMSVKINNRSYIHGFDIDIFVPELNKGIEFDGTYHHSFEYMRKDKAKRKWPDEDVRNYHKLKDGWFKSKGIKILHIKEKDWKKDKYACINRCLEFMGVI